MLLESFGTQIIRSIGAIFGKLICRWRDIAVFHTATDRGDGKIFHAAPSSLNRRGLVDLRWHCEDLLFDRSGSCRLIFLNVFQLILAVELC